MPLTRASEVTAAMREGALDLGELGREGAAVLITVRGWAETKDYGNGECTPVMARVVALTDAGRSVLAGHLDRVAACGIDRWLGGVHLHGRHDVWRWDDARQTIARM